MTSDHSVKQKLTLIDAQMEQLLQELDSGSVPPARLEAISTRVRELRQQASHIALAQWYGDVWEKREGPRHLPGKYAEGLAILMSSSFRSRRSYKVEYSAQVFPAFKLIAQTYLEKLHERGIDTTRPNHVNTITAEMKELGLAISNGVPYIAIWYAMFLYPLGEYVHGDQVLKCGLELIETWTKRFLDPRQPYKSVRYKSVEAKTFDDFIEIAVVFGKGILFSLGCGLTLWFYSGFSFNAPLTKAMFILPAVSLAISIPLALISFIYGQFSPGISLHSRIGKRYKQWRSKRHQVRTRP